MQITRSDNEFPSTQAVYTVPAGQPEAIFESAGRRFRLVRVMIFRDGYDGGVRGQDMSRKAWVFAVQVTKRGTDYKSGMGMHLGLDAVLPVDDPKTTNTESWVTARTQLIDAIVADGWTAELDPTSELDFRFSPREVPAVETELRKIEGVQISRGKGLRSADVPTPEGTAFVGWIDGGQLITGLRDDLQAPIAVPVDLIAEYVAQIVERGLFNSSQRAYLASDLIDDLGRELPWDDAKDAEVRGLVDLDPETEPAVVREFGEAYDDLMGAAFPRTMVLDPIPVDSVQEGDRLLMIDGVTLGEQTGAEDQLGLLVEHVTPATFAGVWSITVWMGGGMVGLLLDSGTKARVLRQR